MIRSASARLFAPLLARQTVERYGASDQTETDYTPSHPGLFAVVGLPGIHGGRSVTLIEGPIPTGDY
jgi:hypothetical protein